MSQTLQNVLGYILLFIGLWPIWGFALLMFLTWGSGPGRARMGKF